MKILVVEDERPIRNALIEMLSDTGHEAVPAEDGNEAVEKVATEKPDLVLLDLTMPGMNGFDVLKECKQNQQLKIPFIVLSNLDQEQDIAKAKELGAADFMSKSEMSSDTLAERIQGLAKN